MRIGETIDITAQRDLGVAARILDLFTAQARIPEAFGFTTGDDGMKIRLTIGNMPSDRRTVLLARLACLPGVRHVVTRAAEPPRLVSA